jgi:hypothetical protein
MKKIITSTLFFLSTSVFSQTWQEKIANKFYSTIDSSKKLECCDTKNLAYCLDYTFTTFEIPYNSYQEVFDNHYESIIDSSTISLIVEDLLKTYKKIPKKFRNNFRRTCFLIETKTEVSRKFKSDLIFAEGKVNFEFSFQSDKPYKIPWYKKLFCF